MFKRILFLYVLSLCPKTLADTPISIEDTRVQDYMDCQYIVATHYKKKKLKVKFKECLIKSGGSYFKEQTAPRRYFYKEKAFKGAVDRMSSGHVFYLLKDLEQTKIKKNDDIPSVFTCDKKNRNDGQCMVCDCFFKDREKTFDEQVMLARTTLSQVISPSFSTSACKVINTPAARQWTDFKSERVVKSTPNFKLKLGEGSDVLSSKHKRQFRRCVRAVKKASKFKGSFFASRFVAKKEKEPKWLESCNQDMKNGKVNLTEDINLMNYHDWSNAYYKICNQRENRCLTYDTCKAPIAGPPKKKSFPPKEILDALLM